MGKTGFSPWPNFTEEEAKAVSEVLLSNRVNYWTGEHVALFEREYAEFIGVKYAVALANGTVALEAALKALSVKERDEVIVTSRSFFASASAIKAAGATPVFADVDLDTQNIDVDCLDSLLSKNTAAIICVHLAGWPCDMDEIMQFAKTNNFGETNYLIDETQEIAKNYGAVCTPDFFGYNKDLELQYRGRYKELKDLKPINNEDSNLKVAMKMIGQTQKGPDEQIPSMGCNIKWFN